MRVSMYRAAAILAAFALTETYAIRLEALEATTGEDATLPTLTQADTEIEAEEEKKEHDQKNCMVKNPHGP